VSDLPSSDVFLASAVQFLVEGGCRMRLEDGFTIREPGFLVCQDGKWGILQVDGEPWHGGHTRASRHTPFSPGSDAILSTTPPLGHDE
jgi:hypothetical protein